MLTRRPYINWQKTKNLTSVAWPLIQDFLTLCVKRHGIRKRNYYFLFTFTLESGVKKRIKKRFWECLCMLMDSKKREKHVQQSFLLILKFLNSVRVRFKCEKKMRTLDRCNVPMYEKSEKKSLKHIRWLCGKEIVTRIIYQEFWKFYAIF